VASVVAMVSMVAVVAVVSVVSVVSVVAVTPMVAVVSVVAVTPMVAVVSVVAVTPMVAVVSVTPVVAVVSMVTVAFVAVLVLRNAAIKVVVPFPVMRATFAMRRRRRVVRATSREADVASSIVMVVELGLGALFGRNCEGKERNKSDRQRLHS